MAHPMDAPDFEIAALKKRQGKAHYDLSMPGPGIPWEVRGNVGVFVGFFKTALMSIFTPARLLNDIRRTDATGDASGFAALCASFWVIAYVTWRYFAYRAYAAYPMQFDVDQSAFIIETIIGAIAVYVGVLLATKIISVNYVKLMSLDMASRFSPTLSYNIFCYLLGASLLAVIPYVGPPAALLIMFVGAMVAGAKRLHAKFSATLIACLVIFAILIAVIAVLYFVVPFAWDYTIGDAVTPTPPPPVLAR